MTNTQAFLLGVMAIMSPSMLLMVMALWTLPSSIDDD